MSDTTSSSSAQVGIPAPSSDPNLNVCVVGRLAAVEQRLEHIESLLDRLVQQRTVKEWYSASEVAEILGKAEFTVREWCRLGRVNAAKRACGRGVSKEWMIAHAELERIRNEGLLPQSRVSTRIQ